MENITLACKQGVLLKWGEGEGPGQGEKEGYNPKIKTAICNRTGYTGMGQTVVEVKYGLQGFSN